MSEAIFQADYTFSFELPKLSFLFAEHENLVGQWQHHSIGLSAAWMEKNDCNYFWLEKKDFVGKIPKRKKHHYKNLAGHCLICGGSQGKIGAILLAAKAALRSGAGLVTVHSIELSSQPLYTYLPEAMFQKTAGSEFIEQIGECQKYQSIALGMGLGTQPATKTALFNFIKHEVPKKEIPLVLDADALNILALESSYLKLLHSKTVLTPHIGEFDRLFGICKNSETRLKMLQKQAQNLKLWIILKGAYSAIANPAGEIFFNSSGTPALATAGSGDILSGILAGLLAQGIDFGTAITSAVFLHGLAAELACKQKKWQNLIASDIIDFISTDFAIVENPQ